MPRSASPPNPKRPVDAHDPVSPPPRLAYRVGNDAAHALGMSRWTLVRLIDAGEIRTVTLGGSRYIAADELQRVLSSKRARS